MPPWLIDGLISVKLFRKKVQIKNAAGNFTPTAFFARKKILINDQAMRFTPFVATLKDDEIHSP